MRLPEAAVSAEAGQDLAAGVVDLLHASHAAYTAILATTILGREHPFAEYFNQQFTRNQALVNETLTAIGGMAVSFSAEDDPHPFLCIITKWHGYGDDDDPALMSWQIAGAPSQVKVSLDLATVTNNRLLIPPSRVASSISPRAPAFLAARPAGGHRQNRRPDSRLI
jgi:hypothetical protein